jgi:hypothetical protein
VHMHALRTARPARTFRDRGVPASWDGQPVHPGLRTADDAFGF